MFCCEYAARGGLWGILLVLVGIFLSTTTRQIPAATTAERPNVIIIYTDDQGSLDLNCYGADDLHTPNLDRLAKEGVRFTQMYSPSAICSASRAGLLTGKTPARAGVPGNVSSHRGHSGMPPEQVTIAEMLKKAGYRTAHIGKWHLGYDRQTMPNAQGFDHSFGHMGGCIDNYSHFFYWVPPNQHDLWLNGKEIWRTGEYFPELMVDQCRDFIETNRQQPFFIYLAFNVPHYPLQATGKWREYYQKVKPLEVRYTNTIDPEVWEEYYHGFRSVRSMYTAFISSIDEQIGRVMEQVDQLGIRENTIVIFQSDHGHSHESRTFWGGGYAGPYRGCKGNLFEGGIRVPSIVSWPGTVPQDEVREQMATGCDWLPTIADWTGAELPEDALDGKSLVPVIVDDAPTPHEHFYWQLGRGNNAQWVVRKGPWKLLGNARDGSGRHLAPEDKKRFLANLQEDVGESTNLIEKYPEIHQQLEAIHKGYAEELK
jgi:arylsulfatase A-like enzyme